MTIVNEERYQNERTIFSSRSEGGVQATLAWLCARRDDLDSKWMGAEGRDLAMMQGEAKGITRLIKVIMAGPTISKPEGASK